MSKNQIYVSLGLVLYIVLGFIGYLMGNIGAVWASVILVVLTAAFLAYSFIWPPKG